MHFITVDVQPLRPAIFVHMLNLDNATIKSNTEIQFHQNNLH